MVEKVLLIDRVTKSRLKVVLVYHLVLIHLDGEHHRLLDLEVTLEDLADQDWMVGMPYGDLQMITWNYSRRYANVCHGD